jgi:hypothetical protein
VVCLISYLVEEIDLANYGRERATSDKVDEPRGPLGKLVNRYKYSSTYQYKELVAKWGIWDSVWVDTLPGLT